MPNLLAQIKANGHCLRPIRPKKEKRKGGAPGYIPRVSARRKAQKARYDQIRPEWLRGHPQCEIGPRIKRAGFQVHCLGRSTSIHHVRGKIGELLCDTRYFLASCSGECHPQFIHQTNKQDAINMGLLIQ